MNRIFSKSGISPYSAAFVGIKKSGISTAVYRREAAEITFIGHPVSRRL